MIMRSNSLPAVPFFSILFSLDHCRVINNLLQGNALVLGVAQGQVHVLCEKLVRYI